MEDQGGASAPPDSVREAKVRKLQANLDKANVARKAKRLLREGIKAKEIDDLQVLRGDSKYEDLIAGWPIERLLLLMRRIGKSRVTDILDFARIRPHTKLRALTFGQREQLCQLVEEARRKGGVT